MNLRHLANAVGLRKEEAIRLRSGGTPLECPFDVTPEDFLERAEDDFELGGTSAVLNALTNAKRAIDCQIDTVLAALGIPAAKLSRVKKLQFLLDTGFIAPRILRRVNNARNLLEHEYRSPSSEVVEEALDIAALFVGATSRRLEVFEDEFAVGNASEQLDFFTFERELIFGFDDERHVFRVRGIISNRSEHERFEAIETGRHLEAMPKEVGTVEIRSTNDAFPLIIRLINSADRASRVREALQRLFTHIETLPAA